jgi:hypothetical protein
MGKNKSFTTVKRSRSTIKTVTKTVEVPPRKDGEDNFNYYIRLKKLGLKLPTDEGKSQ